MSGYFVYLGVVAVALVAVSFDFDSTFVEVIFGPCTVEMSLDKERNKDGYSPAFFISI